jgi:hypothetical protein
MKQGAGVTLLALAIILGLSDSNSVQAVHSHQQAGETSYLWSDLEPRGDRSITYWPCPTSYPNEWVTGVENWDAKLLTWAFNLQSEANCNSPEYGKTVLRWEASPSPMCLDIDPVTQEPIYACWQKIPPSPCSTADDDCDLLSARILFDYNRFYGIGGNPPVSTSWKTALAAHEWGHTLDLTDHKEDDMCSLGTIMGRLGSNLGGTACMTGPQPGDVGSVRCNAYGYCGDYEGDTCTDVLARRADAQNALRLYEGNCASGWGGTNTQIGNGWGPSAFNWILRPGDFDSKSSDTQSRGCTDVIARDIAGYLKLYKGSCSASYPSGPATIGNGWQSFSWLFGPGDFDGDGCADVIARSGSQLLLYGGNCNYWWVTFGTVVGSGFGSSVWTWLLAPGDFDGDGCVDLIGRQTNGTLWLYTGSCGIGGWWKNGQGINISGGVNWNQYDWLLSPGDFSGDGCMDVLGRNVYDAKLYMRKGNCNGGWAGSPTAVGTGWHGSAQSGWINWIDNGPNYNY